MTINQFMFLLMSMFVELKFTPFLCIIIMMRWCPCVTTNMESKRFVFNVVSIIIVGIMMLIVATVIYQWDRGNVKVFPRLCRVVRFEFLLDSIMIGVIWLIFFLNSEVFMVIWLEFIDSKVVRDD